MDIRCPVCGREDMVQKVSAIHAAGLHFSSSVTTGLKAGAVGSAGGPEPAAAVAGVSSRGRSQSALSVRLAPPPQPRRRRAWVHFLLGWIGGTVGMFMVLAILYPKSGGIALAVFAAVLGAAFGLALYAVGMFETNSLQVRAKMQWQTAYQEWDRHYYCARDDRVFTPGPG